MNGASSPPRGFTSCAEYEGVSCTMRLKNGVVWLIPNVLNVTQEFAQSIGAGGATAPHNLEGGMPTALHVVDIWQVRRMAELETVCGTVGIHHLRPSESVYRIKTGPDRGCANRCCMASSQKRLKHRCERCPGPVSKGFARSLGKVTLLFNARTILLPGLIAGVAGL